MAYIRRALQDLVKQTAEEYPALLIPGPRQVGKSTLLEHVVREEKLSVKRVTLDDLTERQLAIEDPAMFFQIHRPPVLIDEVQYAPELFTEIKKMIDEGAGPGSFWLTGSQQFRLMELAGETLAGRIAILPLSSLSQSERASVPSSAFIASLDMWSERDRRMPAKNITQLFDEMHAGAMPAIASGERTNIDVFYSSYVQTYIERDVRRLLGNIDALQYIDFMRAVAARCSHMLNIASIAEDVGIRQDKAKAWLSVLERSGIIFYLHPFSNNQLKRTVKAPKLYVHDCGLVAHLARWSSGETMMSGAMSGAFFENFVVSEIRKGFLNAGVEPPLYYYRDHDGREIDLVIVKDGQAHPVEVKKTASPNPAMAKSFKVLDRATVKRGRGAIVCASEHFGALSEDVLVIPARLL